MIYISHYNAGPVGSPVALRSGKDPYSVWSSATIVHACYPKELLMTQLLDLPWPGSFYGHLPISELEAWSVFSLQILFALNRVTSKDWFIPSNIKTAISLGLIVNGIIRFSDLIAKSTRNTKVMASRGGSRSVKEFLIWEWNPSPSYHCRHRIYIYFWAEKRLEAVNKLPDLPSLLISYPPGLKPNG